MNPTIKITGRLIAAARALTGVNRKDFAAAVGVTPETLTAMESNGSAWLHSASEAEGVCRAFDKFGVIVLDEEEGMGAGVRLKFTRQDVRQIARLESEGGVVGSDDAP